MKEKTQESYTKVRVSMFIEHLPYTEDNIPSISDRVYLLDYVEGKNDIREYITEITSVVKEEFKDTLISYSIVSSHAEKGNNPISWKPSKI